MPELFASKDTFFERIITIFAERLIISTLQHTVKPYRHHPEFLH